MAKYNAAKIYSELDKLTEGELYIQFQNIKDFVQKKLAEAQEQKQNEASELQSKIDRLAGN